MSALRPARSRRKTLRVQADVPHTFGTLLIPLALALLAGGIFLVLRPLADPLGSGIEFVLLGSVILACGLLLVVFLLRSVRISRLSKPQEENISSHASVPRPVVRRLRVSDSSPPPSSPLHRIYVDHVRIFL